MEPKQARPSAPGEQRLAEEEARRAPEDDSATAHEDAQEDDDGDQVQALASE